MRNDTHKNTKHGHPVSNLPDYSLLNGKAQPQFDRAMHLHNSNALLLCRYSTYIVKSSSPRITMTSPLHRHQMAVFPPFLTAP